ncbi:G-type lectin S-receptor serine/threonine-protein kinase [Trifolium repens]|nr:G-type lectin S-receptor serine/threonine-protein kinase [Trifolium repens]
MVIKISVEQIVWSGELIDCSCTAYAYDPYIGCMYWSGELIDLQKFPYGGVVLFIRVPAELDAIVVVSNSNKKGKGHKKSFLSIPIVVGIGAFILVICAFLWWKKSSTRDKE